MRLAIMALAIVCLVAVPSRVGGDDGNRGDLRAVRKELSHMKDTLLRLINRIERLEQRLGVVKSGNTDKYPWQKEQPFYWDSTEFSRDIVPPSPSIIFGPK